MVVSTGTVSELVDTVNVCEPGLTTCFAVRLPIPERPADVLRPAYTARTAV